MKHQKLFVIVFAALLIVILSVTIADAQGPKPGARAPQALAGTAFTYQGQLKNSGAAVNGTCDFQFSLWDDASVGAQVGATQTVSGLAVSNGLFTTPIDFGVGAFTGDARWLNIAVRCPAGSGNYTPLTPRQALTPAPMAFALPGLYTQQNATSPNIIGGYSGNVISPTVVGGTISGGGYSGYENKVVAHYGTIGGGWKNTVSGDGAFVGGGVGNTASGNKSTVAGGNGNIASGHGAVVGGGGYNGTNYWINHAKGNGSTIGGGLANSTSPTATHSTIAGGYNNNAMNYSTAIGGGYNNTASGEYATVPGGYYNKAQGDYSFAAGRYAQANHNGAFVWGDSTVAYVTSTANNQFLIRASGGITMYTNSGATTGVQVAPGSGSWSSVSDKNLKANFTNTNGRAVLDALANVPIQSWNYKSQDATIRHIGPMAQDFYAAFNVGEDDTHIATIDADGVALAAIQGLHQENQELKSQITNLETRLAVLEQNAQASNPINSNNIAMIVIGALLGIVVAQRMGNRGER